MTCCDHIEYPNKDDWNEDFYRNKYEVLVTKHCFCFHVNADNAQEALDFVIDFIEEKERWGLLWSREQEDAMPYEELEEYPFGGNHGRFLSTHNLRIIKLEDQ